MSNKNELQFAILQIWNVIKMKEKGGASTSFERKLLKEQEDLYRYHYEGGDRPKTLNGTVYPQSSNNLWVGCHHCDWERQLNDNENENSDFSPGFTTNGCPNLCNKGHLVYPSNNRKSKSRGDWLDSYKREDVGGGGITLQLCAVNRISGDFSDYYGNSGLLLTKKEWK